MANHYMVWAEFGRPNQSAWTADGGRGQNAGPNHGLFPGGYYLLDGEASEGLRSAIQENEKARLLSKSSESDRMNDNARRPSYAERLWKGWVLPGSSADTWFVAGAAAYYRLLQSDDLDKALETERIVYRGLKLSPDNAANSFRVEQIKGVLFLDSIRRKMGDDAFLKLMADYFTAKSTTTVTAQSFLDRAGATFEFTEPAAEGPAYLAGDIGRRLASAAIVYGTVAEAGVNRYAAEQLRDRYRDIQQTEVSIYKDFETSDEMLRSRDVIFVGRPETNSALAAWSEKIGLDYHGAVFKINGQIYASERNSLVLAAKNPFDATHMVVVYAGNDPLHTVEALNGTGGQAEVVLEDGKPIGQTGRGGRAR